VAFPFAIRISTLIRSVVSRQLECKNVTLHGKTNGIARNARNHPYPPSSDIRSQDTTKIIHIHNEYDKAIAGN